MPDTGNSPCSSLSTLYAEMGIPDMRRLLMVTSLLAVLLSGAGVTPAPKVPVKVQVKHQPSEQDAAKA